MSRAQAAPARRRRDRHAEEEHENHERWLVSYSDMITVLMGLFIVLFAISQVDQDKYVALRDSLAAGFQTAAGSASVLDGGSGTLDGLTDAVDTAPAAEGTAGDVAADAGPGSLAPAVPGPDPALLVAARAEADHLARIEQQIAQALTTHGVRDAVAFRVDERGLTIGLVADDVFFAASSADLTATARVVLDAAGPTLASIDEQISVEGHANVLPVSGRYATNWELSSDRATQVLRHLVENDGVAGPRIMAVGLGDQRPLVPDVDSEGLAANRRVDLVVLSAAPERVRELVPRLVGKDA